MTTDSTDERNQPSNKTRFLNFTLALLVWVLAILILCGYRFIPPLASFADMISPKRITYLFVFVGTILGAVAATKKKDTPVLSRWRDILALWAWAFVSVGAFAALLFA